MKLKSSNKIVVFLLLFALFKPLSAEDQIDIWSKPKKNEISITKMAFNDAKTIFYRWIEIQ